MTIARDDQPSLEWLIAPVSAAEFFGGYWEKRPLVVPRGQRNYFEGLVSLAEIDRVLATMDRRYPDVALKNAARAVTADDYAAANGQLDIARVYQLFEEGSTVSLAYLDTVLPALTLFCRRMEQEFSCPFQTNAYLTPPGAQGARVHYDTHDVFVLQVAGSKQWRMFGTPIELPLPNQQFESGVHEPGPLSLEFELQPGDVACIPRGLTHEARSTDTISLHITAGVLRYTWADFLLQAVARASLQDAAFRKALPPGFARTGFDREQAREMFPRLLSGAGAAEHFDEVFDYFADRLLEACPPLLEGQMEQMARIHALEADSEVGAREGVVFRVESSGDVEAVHCYGRTIAFPAPAREAVRFALSQARFRVRDLPGRLDEASKLTIVRRLIREGLVRAL